MIQNFFLQLLNKRPVYAHLIALLLGAAVYAYSNIPAVQHDVLYLVHLVPAQLQFLVPAIGANILWYINHQN